MESWDQGEDISSSAASLCPPLPPTTVWPSAHDTLGLAALNQHHDCQFAHCSLALELDMYLNDLQEGTDLLIDWKVCQASCLHSTSTYPWCWFYRRTGFTTQLFPISLCTFYPFRPPLFHMSECSHQPKRPWLHVAIISAQKWWKHYRFSSTHFNIITI